MRWDQILPRNFGTVASALLEIIKLENIMLENIMEQRLILRALWRSQAESSNSDKNWHCQNSCNHNRPSYETLVNFGHKQGYLTKWPTWRQDIETSQCKSHKMINTRDYGITDYHERSRRLWSSDLHTNRSNLPCLPPSDLESTIRQQDPPASFCIYRLA